MPTAGGGLLSASNHPIGARLSVPATERKNSTKPQELVRPRSASLRSVGSKVDSFWDEEKRCVICPLKEAIRAQSPAAPEQTLPVEGASENALGPLVQQHANDATGTPFYRSYAQRWVVLGTVCLLALSNATQWIAFAPLHEAANLFYCSSADPQKNQCNETRSSGLVGAGCDVETWSSQIFQLVGVLTGLFGMFVTDQFGIRISCHFGSALNLCGAIFRVLSSLPQLPKSSRLPILYFGNSLTLSSPFFLISFSPIQVKQLPQPVSHFFLCLSPKVAEYWFQEDQRALANSLSFIANPFGVFLGSIAPVIFVASTDGSSRADHQLVETGILYLNLSLLGLAIVVMLSCLFVTRSQPPTPPSASSECEHKPRFGEGLCILFRSPVFYIQTLTFGMAFALQWQQPKLLTVNAFSLNRSIFVTADKQLIGLGYGEYKVAGYLLSLSAFSGTIASIFSGWLVDRTKKFNEFIKVSYLGIAVSAVALDVFLHHRHQSDWSLVILVLLFALLGFFAIPVFPISLELGVESTFPVAEATSSGILIIAGQLQLFLLTFAMQSMETVDWIYGEELNYKLSIDLWALCAIFAVLFSCLFLWPRYYRLEYEQNAVFLNLLPPRFDEIRTAAENGQLGCENYYRMRRRKCSNHEL